MQQTNFTRADFDRAAAALRIGVKSDYSEAETARIAQWLVLHGQGQGQGKRQGRKKSAFGDSEAKTTAIDTLKSQQLTKEIVTAGLEIGYQQAVAENTRDRELLIQAADTSYTKTRKEGMQQLLAEVQQLQQGHTAALPASLHDVLDAQILADYGLDD